MMELETERNVIFLENDICNNTQIAPSSSETFQSILKNPLIMLGGKTHKNLKINILQKRCEPKKTYITTLENDDQRELQFDQKKPVDIMAQSNKEMTSISSKSVIKNGLNHPFKGKDEFPTSLKLNHISRNGFPFFNAKELISHDECPLSDEIRIKNISSTFTRVKPYEKSLNLNTRALQKNLSPQVENSLFASCTNSKNLLKESFIDSSGTFSFKRPEKNCGRSTKTHTITKLDLETPTKSPDIKNSSMEHIGGLKNNHKKRKQHPNRRLQSEKSSSGSGFETITISEMLSKITKPPLKLKRPGKSKHMDVNSASFCSLDLSKTKPSDNIFLLPKNAEKITEKETVALKKPISVKMEQSENCLLRNVKSTINLNVSLFCSQSVTKARDTKSCGKRKRLSESWVDVLETSDFQKAKRLKSETVSQVREHDSTNHEATVDYQKMLNDFVAETAQETKKVAGKTLNDKRFNEMLEDPDCKKNLLDYYIPPARVESFYQKFTDDITSEDCLTQVCEAKKWPEPKFNQKYCKDGFLFSCVLKTKEITPPKSASNESLAKELAAASCLDWLGLTRRKVGRAFWQSTEDTYFTY